MVIDHGTFDTLISENPDAWLLYSHLLRQHWGRDFVLSKAMASSMQWGIPRWRAAREALKKLGFIECVRPGGMDHTILPSIDGQRDANQYLNKK